MFGVGSRLNEFPSVRDVGFLLFLSLFFAIIYLVFSSEKEFEPLIFLSMLASVSICIVPLTEWLTSKRHILDPLPLFCMFSLHFVVFSPFLQYSMDFYPYLFWDDKNESFVKYWFLFAAVMTVIVVWVARKNAILPMSMRGNQSLFRLDKSVLSVLCILLIVAVVAKCLVVLKFGGIGGLLSAYEDRLSVGVSSYNPLSGIGPVVYIGDSIPVLVALAMTFYFKNREPSVSTLFLAFLIFGIISLLVVGLTGSRSNFIYTVFFAFSYVALIVKRLNLKWIFLGVLLIFVFMNVYMAYKFGGVEALFDEGKRQEIMINRQIENPLAFVAMRDFGRMDVQVTAMREVALEDYPLSLGRSYIGGLASVIPSALFPNRPDSFTKEKTEIVFPGMAHVDEIETNLVFGGYGEAFVNFGYAAILLAIPFGFLIGSFSRKFYVSSHAPRDLALYPAYSILPIAILIYDSNSLMYFSMQFVLMPIIITYFNSKK
ncbi:hypothetical protein [Chitinibacter sp. GC72]|uniref:hypothetical protein n=1 Tax=Chitinibacter sp. GC72 TaxID=1526917 RepID=UPI0012F96AC4|nr:hypothetical protein [Chitinibacter sp. GC72]